MKILMCSAFRKPNVQMLNFRKKQQQYPDTMHFGVMEKLTGMLVSECIQK